MRNRSIHVILPSGSTHGWAICSRYLTLELSRLAEVGFVTDHMESPEKYVDPHDVLLAQLAVPIEGLQKLGGEEVGFTFPHPVLQAIEGPSLRPWFVRGKAPRLVGYTFFEKSSLDKQAVADAELYFDWIVAGSSWCEEVLKEFGIKQSKTILQGVDTEIFHKGHAQKRKHPNHFVVFSGGKMEFRKGQDLVIRAFKVLQDRHDDVLLVNCWYNRWDAATASMSMSPHVRFEMPRGRYVDAVRHLLSVNGIQPQKAVICEPVHHSQVAEIYRDTDCGVFPNRCEGGTNLVLMEYMACGKPAIASYNTGHRDVLSREHAMLLEHQRPLDILDRNGNLHTRWYESSLDEIVWKLEWAYQNRDLIKEIGLAGARYISQYTWEKAAREFLPLLSHDGLM